MIDNAFSTPLLSGVLYFLRKTWYRLCLTCQSIPKKLHAVMELMMAVSRYFLNIFAMSL